MQTSCTYIIETYNTYVLSYPVADIVWRSFADVSAILCCRCSRFLSMMLVDFHMYAIKTILLWSHADSTEIPSRFLRANETPHQAPGAPSGIPPASSRATLRRLVIRAHIQTAAMTGLRSASHSTVQSGSRRDPHACAREIIDHPHRDHESA